VKELYGTYLTHVIHKELEKKPQTISSIVVKLAPTLFGRERKNLKYRIRTSLKKLIEYGFVKSEWIIHENGNAYKLYSIINRNEFKRT
jgi:hypothetical protein